MIRICKHCGRKLNEDEPRDKIALAGSFIVTLHSPVMDRPSPPYFIGGCCSQDLAEYVEPDMKHNKERQAMRARIEQNMREWEEAL